MFNVTFTKHNAMKIKKINKHSKVETTAGKRRILFLEITEDLCLDKKGVWLFFIPLSHCFPERKVKGELPNDTSAHLSFSK